MLGRVLTLTVIVAAVASAAGAQNVRMPEIEFGRYHALIIGNNDYQHLRNLTTAVGDAEAVATLLEDKYGFKVTKLINATRRDIAGAFNRLRQALTEKDNLLVYYAGHGVLDEEANRGYWQPVDARPDDDTDWFSNGRLTGYLNAMTARHVMVVADSCYSGNLTRVATSTVRSGAERSAWMERMNDRRSRTALTSGGLEPVLDRGGGGHSVFAKAFLAALEKNPEVLFGEELFDRVKGVVVANADQTPEYSDIRYTGHEKGDFLFVPLDINVSVTVRTPAPTRSDREVVFWQSVQDSDDPTEFEAYLSRYPDGAFAVLARNRLGKLKASRTTALVPSPKPKPPTPVTPAVGVYPAPRRPGETFRDCADCPEMVVIPAGSFTMGSPESEEGRDDDEGPRHRVTIPRAFALGKHEVTRAEFTLFVRDTGHKARGCNVRPGMKWKYDMSKGWRDPSFSQSERDPVVCMNWHDAKAYVRWLARKTGKDYRLPSEAEWEYAARAGTTTARFWGEDADRACGYGNVHDLTSKTENSFTLVHHDCRDGYGQTAPVGSFRANDFGLYDVLGNVYEWVDDCYEKSYDLTPRDGTALTTGECELRGVRGGSWINISWLVRAADRFGYSSGIRSDVVGFRVARTLP